MADSSQPTALAPLTGGTLVITAIALAIGTFMQVLDTTIANVSIPTIAGNMGATISQGTWIITAFAVANGISVPLTGWLMARFGVVRTFVVSVLLFTLASFLCGIAWNLPSLILFRVIQGAVSGPMIPGSQTLLLMIFPREKQATGLAIWSMTTLVAPISGPILGGFISDNVAWQWIFLINVPIGFLCAFLCWGNLKSRDTATVKLPVDTLGFVMLVVWIGAFQIMLDTGKDADWFASPLIVIELLIAIVIGVAWVIWELTAKHPIVDLSLFKNRNFLLGTITFCLGYAIFFANTLLLPLWLQTQMGYLATWAGLVAAPAGFVALILTPLVAKIIGKIDARFAATWAIGFFALSFYMRSLYAPDASFGELIWPMFVMGVGMSCFFMALVTISISNVPPHKIPQATGLQNFARITAGAFSASLVTTFWERSATMHQTRLVEITGSSTNGAWDQTIATLQAQGMNFQQAMAVMTQQIAHQAVFLASVDIFRISAFLALVLVPLIWLTKRARGGVHVAASE
jgi:DHA2 family multidrug resistance protein